MLLQRPCRQSDSHAGAQGAFSEAGDVYALGVVMWEMAHQRRAWGGKRLDHVVRAVVRRRRTPKFQAHLPEHLTVCGGGGGGGGFMV